MTLKEYLQNNRNLRITVEFYASECKADGFMDKKFSEDKIRDIITEAIAWRDELV